MADDDDSFTGDLDVLGLTDQPLKVVSYIEGGAGGCGGMTRAGGMIIESTNERKNYMKNSMIFI